MTAILMVTLDLALDVSGAVGAVVREEKPGPRTVRFEPGAKASTLREPSTSWAVGSGRRGAVTDCAVFTKSTIRARSSK